MALQGARNAFYPSDASSVRTWGEAGEGSAIASSAPSTHSQLGGSGTIVGSSGGGSSVRFGESASSFPHFSSFPGRGESSTDSTMGGGGGRGEGGGGLSAAAGGGGGFFGLNSLPPPGTDPWSHAPGLEVNICFSLLSVYTYVILEYVF